MIGTVQDFSSRSHRSLSELNRLLLGQSLSDSIVMEFCYTLLDSTTNVADIRFFAIDSQDIKVSNGLIRRHYKNIAFHDIDTVIWTFIYKYNWHLCIDYTKKREVVLFNPFWSYEDYGSNEIIPEVAKLALRGLELISKDYDERNSTAIF